MTDETPRCTATSTQSGERCRKRPIVGGTVCFTHGGATPQVKAKAAERVVEMAVAREIGRQGWEPVTDPVGAYADNAGEVLAFKDRLRERVEQLDDWTLRIAAMGFGGDEGDGDDGKQLMAMGEQVRAYVAAYERSLDRAERTLARMISLGFDAKALQLRAEEINKAAGVRMHGVLVAVLGELGHDVAPGSVAAQVILRHMAPLRESVDGTCKHEGAQPVTLSTGEVVAAVCPTCMAQLSPMALEAGGAA